MSGFLQQLISRAEGHGGGPRVRPASTAGLMATDDWGEVEGEAEPPAARVQPVTGPADDGVAAVAAPFDPAPSRWQPPPAASRPALAAASPRVATLRERDAQAMPSRPPSVTRRSAASPAATPRAANEPATPQAAPPRPEPLQAPRSATRVDTAREPAAAFAPNVQPAARRHAAATAAAPAREPESVVHVSIGRVELTALLPPAAARAKPTPRQPTTSLADYLRGSGARK